MARNSVRLFSLMDTKFFKTKTRKKKKEQIILLGFWHNQVECDRLDSALRSL